MAEIYIGNVKGPQGDTGATGPQGAAGDAATIQVGTVSTTAYGNPAQVSNSGTEHEAVLNFVIPQGAPGATVTQLDNLALNTITTSTDQYPQIQVGDLGRVIFGKIIKFFQDLVTGLAAKVNYSDALTMEEIEAASDLTNKVAAASAADTLKESLTNITEGQFNLSVATSSNSSWYEQIGRLVIIHFYFTPTVDIAQWAIFADLPVKAHVIGSNVVVRGSIAGASNRMGIPIHATEDNVRCAVPMPANTLYAGELVYFSKS